MKRIALLGGAALAATAALSAAPALASTTAPAAVSAPAARTVPLIGAYKLCLRSDHTECLTSEGTNVQMKIFQAGYSTFNADIQSNGDVIFVNQTGNCVHGTDTGTVTVSSSCSSSNTASEWVEVTQNGTLEFQNAAYVGLISTKGDGSGDNVFLQAQGTSGAWFVTDLLTAA